MPTYINLASTTLGSNSSTFTFTSISQGYTDLLVKWSLRTNKTPGWSYDYFNIRFNNISAGGNYSWNSFNASGGSTGASTNGGIGQIESTGSAGGDTPVNAFSVGELYIPSYTNSNTKQVFTHTGVPPRTNVSPYEYYQQQVFGVVQFTSAINRIDITSVSSLFLTGSSVYIYGIKNS